MIGADPGVIVDVMVVGRRAAERWRVAGALGQGAGAAVAPDLAASRLAHPATTPPEAVVLLAEDRDDLAWLRAHVARSPRHWVPVVALVARRDMVGAARAGGAAAVLCLQDAAEDLADELRATLARVTAPAVVIHLDPVRSA